MSTNNKIKYPEDTLLKTELMILVWLGEFTHIWKPGIVT